MGIIAHCPNRHRVKVKDQLAGRKGICPECGARFRIPASGETALSPSASPPIAGHAQFDSGLDRPGRPLAKFVSLDAERAAALPRALPLAGPRAQLG
jgi:hypothetical protein